MVGRCHIVLLKRASIDNGKGNQKAKTRKLIFQSCAVLIQREHDIPLCEHLLRYVALSHVINEGVPEDLHKEFLHILKMDSKSTSPDRAEQLKLCYQTIFLFWIISINGSPICVLSRVILGQN